VAAVQRWLPGEVRLGPTESGFHACLHLAAELPDTLVVQRLAQRRIGGEALSSRCRQAGRHNGVVLSYAAASPPEIDAAMRQLAEVIGELSHERPAGPSRHPVPD
jgi:DNA-binding transcriptional MocR family regulator